MDRVARLAALVVLEAPVRSAHSFQSYVRRNLIAELEEALNAAGYDMSAARLRMKEIEKQRK